LPYKNSLILQYKSAKGYGPQINVLAVFHHHQCLQA
jgi:hypothetical protein